MTTRKRKWRCAVGILGGFAALWGAYTLIRPDDVVALTIGQSYEQVRQQSRSTLPPSEPSGNWFGYVNRPAIFRFTDPQYGFVTPAAKFLAVSYDEKRDVWAVRLSPQVKTLSLDASMAILVDLQGQLRRGGWKPYQAHRYRPLDDTPAMRAEIRSCNSHPSYWRTTDNVLMSLDIRCFKTEDHPNDERYLITLSMHRTSPDYPPDED